MEEPDAAVVRTDEQSHFSIDSSTRNIQKKVIWCPNRNSWMLLCKLNAKEKTISHIYEDETGKPLTIPECTLSEDYTVQRRKMYVRAIHAWNVLDLSNQSRIPELSAREGTCPSSPTSTSPITSSSVVETSPSLSSTVNASQTETGSIASESVSDNSSVASAGDSLVSEGVSCV